MLTAGVHHSAFLSKLSAMLKWAMRIVAVGGAMLALAVGTAAWMHRTQGRVWYADTPGICASTVISPQYVLVERSGTQRGNGVGSISLGDSGTENIMFRVYGCDSVLAWHGFGFLRGFPCDPTYAGVFCPTWAMIAALLLPMGLWAGIGWRQRRRVSAGHCVNCGYDLRATREKCPECGRTV